VTAAHRQPAQVAEISVGQEVAVAGPLDVNTVADVRTALHNILDRGVGDLLVHLAEAEVYDATGLGVIVGVHHRAQRVERRLVLVDVSPRLDRLLRASRLHLVLAREPGHGRGDRMPPAGWPATTLPVAGVTALPTPTAPSPVAESGSPASDPGSPASANVGSVVESVVLFTD
jgi:anti-sigma B factor antagonist